MAFALLVTATGGSAQRVAADSPDTSACDPTQQAIDIPTVAIFIAPSMIFIPPIPDTPPQEQQPDVRAYPGDGLGRGSCW